MTGGGEPCVTACPFCLKFVETHAGSCERIGLPLCDCEDREPVDETNRKVRSMDKRRRVLLQVVPLVRQARRDGMTDEVEIAEYVISKLGDEVDWEALIKLVIEIIMLLLRR